MKSKWALTDAMLLHHWVGASACSAPSFFQVWGKKPASFAAQAVSELCLGPGVRGKLRPVDSAWVGGEAQAS